METIEKQEVSEYETERGKPTPSRQHGILQSRISTAISIRYGDKYEPASEVTLNLSDIKPYVPDLCIFPKAPVNWTQEEVKVSEVPITAVEIISYSQTVEEILEKFRDYFSAGVQSCWLVIPPLQTIYVILPDNKIKVFHEDILTDSVTGISIDLNEIFS
ncbi:MAG: Uma2 family endonuclease [Cytophagales bacterium]|jgi:Uma2 family endonuclease|nr:Uma2 family endonuclease [Cytophagales bacterium]